MWLSWSVPEPSTTASKEMFLATVLALWYLLPYVAPGDMSKACYFRLVVQQEATLSGSTSQELLTNEKNLGA